jgi:hypothetical protein
MSLDAINQELANIANSGDPTFASAANWIMQATQAAQGGHMSSGELAEALRDIQRQMDIIQDMSQLAYKEKLNTCINGIIALAGVV